MDIKTGFFYVFSAILLFASFRVITAKNPVHAALFLVLAFFQASAIWMLLKAEFLAIALVLVYVGAISMVVLFAVLLTRPPDPMPATPPNTLGRALVALITGGAVLGVLIGAIVSSPLPGSATPVPTVSVKQLGLDLAGRHAGALLIVGALLTVALLGAVVLAAVDRADSGKDRP